MLFDYEVITTNTGEKKIGQIYAMTQDLAITALQRRGLIVSFIKESSKNKKFLDLVLFEKVPLKEIVLMSRQIALLFDAQISALKAFTLLSGNTENKLLSRVLIQITDDLQSGTSIADALSKHPKVFSDFYVGMVRAGEETGKLNTTFLYLADYLERQYALTSKTKNALIYPAFVIGIFIVIMSLMFVFVIPKLSDIIRESGQTIPFHTKIIMGISKFLVDYGIFVLIFLAGGVFYLYRISKTEKGKKYLDGLKLKIPFIKTIFQKLYLARLSDNMDTMLSSGIPIVRAIEITAGVIGNKVYQDILKNAVEKVKSGSSFSDALNGYEEVPSIMSQMIKVGEETGSINKILKTLGRFYDRSAKEAVDTLVGLIEPIMIVALGLGVGILLASILLPIYNIASGIS